MGSIIAFAITHWKWFAMGALAAALAVTMQISGHRAQELTKVTAEAAAATQRANDWADHAKAVEGLASATIKARADERRDLLAIVQSASTAKQEIDHAPGADSPFTYSDPAYRFMRNGQPQAAAGPNPPPAAVDRH